jgi:hypothetical protein
MPFDCLESVHGKASAVDRRRRPGERCLTRHWLPRHVAASRDRSLLRVVAGCVVEARIVDLSNVIAGVRTSLVRVIRRGCQGEPRPSILGAGVSRPSTTGMVRGTRSSATSAGSRRHGAAARRGGRGLSRRPIGASGGTALGSCARGVRAGRRVPGRRCRSGPGSMACGRESGCRGHWGLGGRRREHDDRDQRRLRGEGGPLDRAVDPAHGHPLVTRRVVVASRPARKSL